MGLSCSPLGLCRVAGAFVELEVLLPHALPQSGN